MSKLWTKSEEAVLTDYMGTRRVLYWRDKLAIHKMLPNRSPAAIEKRWGIMLKRQKQWAEKCAAEARERHERSESWREKVRELEKKQMELRFKNQVPSFLDKIAELGISGGLAGGVGDTVLVTEHPRCPIEQARQLLYKAGLRGRVTIELGE